MLDMAVLRLESAKALAAFQAPGATSTAFPLLSCWFSFLFIAPFLLPQLCLCLWSLLPCSEGTSGLCFKDQPA